MRVAIEKCSARKRKNAALGRWHPLNISPFEPLTKAPNGLFYEFDKRSIASGTPSSRRLGRRRFQVSPRIPDTITLAGRLLRQQAIICNGSTALASLALPKTSGHCASGKLVVTTTAHRSCDGRISATTIRFTLENQGRSRVRLQPSLQVTIIISYSQQYPGVLPSSLCVPRVSVPTIRAAALQKRGQAIGAFFRATESDLLAVPLHRRQFPLR